MKALKVDALPTKQLISRTSGEKLSIVSSVSDAFSLTKLLIHREIIPPGCRTAPIHQHSLKEEIFIVESGCPSMWLNGQVQKLTPGDAVGLKPESGMRMLFNDSSDEAIVWTIGSNELADVVEFLEKNDK